MGSPSHHSHPIHSMVKQRLQPSLLQRLTLNLKLHHTMDGVAMVAGATGKGLPMPTLRLPLDAMEVVADMVVVVDTGARGLLMQKPAPTMADTMAVIMGKDLPMPMLRLP